MTWEDRAWQSEENMLESSGRNEGNEKGKNGRERKAKEFVDWKRGLAGKVEGILSGKQQETFKREGKLSVKCIGLWKALWKPMGRGMNWKNEWEDEEGQVVREWGGRMVTEL